jgi:hypothetical protein
LLEVQVRVKDFWTLEESHVGSLNHILFREHPLGIGAGGSAGSSE